MPRWLKFALFVVVSHCWSGAGLAQSQSSSSGTAFFVNQIGWLATNAHVVEDCRDVEVVGYGKVDKRLVDHDNDIAAIHVTTTRLTAALPINPHQPRLGEEVIALGFPLVGILSPSVKMTMGNVNSLKPYGSETRYLQISAPLQPGNSGGPLLDMTGRVVGMNSMILDPKKLGIDVQNINFAIKSSVIEKFLSARSIEYVSKPEGRRLASVADVAEVAEKSTALVLCYGNTKGGEETAVLPAPQSDRQPTLQAIDRWFLAVYGNVDFWGGDKYPKGLEIDSPVKCAEMCARDVDCKLFTYNDAYKRCFIKTKLDIVVITEGMISGLIFNKKANNNENPKPPNLISDFVSVQGSEFTGFFWSRFQPRIRIASIDQCLRYCKADNNCTYLTFNQRESGTGSCKIRRFRASDMRSNPNATSFRRHQEAVTPATDIVELDVPRIRSDPADVLSGSISE